MYADLHTHTTASDGTFTPAELVRAAANCGLSVVAVTDHDTVAGLAEAAREAAAAGIGFVPGVELSVEGSPGKCHLLGLGIDPQNAVLRQTLAEVSGRRQSRNARMTENLQALGVPLTLAEVTAAAPPDANVGRPHFAQALVDKGIVADLSEAFDRFLGDNAPAYVPSASLAPGEAIALIHAAGGLAFLAHPGLVRLAPGETARERLAALKVLGLDGIEVFYPKHTVPQIDRFQSLARDLGLLVTGGSDVHGANKPDVPLGVVVDGHGVALPLLPPVLLRVSGAS